MGRAIALAFAAVLALAAVGPMRSFLTLEREVLAATPAAYTGTIVPVPLDEGEEACADQITYAPNAELARFAATARPGEPAPPLRVTVDARDGRYRSVQTFAGEWLGRRTFTLALPPLRAPAVGVFCVANVGERPIDLSGTKNDRSFARPAVQVDGQSIDEELSLTLLEREHSSLLARAGDVVAHVAALTPFGVGALWGFLALVAVGLPTAGFLALRGAVRESGPLPARAAWRPPRRPALPPDVRARLERTPTALLLGAFVLAATGYLLFWAAQTHVFQSDEELHVTLARWLPGVLPEGLWELDIHQRGTQRLEVWLIAVCEGLLPTPQALVLARGLNALAFASIAVPVFLLARGVGLARGWATLPAALSVFVPWAVVTTALLTESLAYAAFGWIVWGVWRAAVRPSPGNDALALVLLGIGGLARTGLLVLAPLLPLVVVAHGVRHASLARVLRAHWVVWSAVGLAAVVLVLGGDRLAGTYGTPFSLAPDLLEKLARFLSRVVAAVPWLIRELVRPASPARGAFALTAVLAAALVLYGLNPAGYDERYIVYLAPLVFLPATVALARRELPRLGAAITAVLVGLLLARVPWRADAGEIGFFSFPTEYVWVRALGLRLDRYLPGDEGVVLAILPWVVAALGVGLAVAARRRGSAPAWGEVAVIGFVAAACLAQTQYTLAKHVNGAGARFGPGLAERGWVERSLPGDVPAAILAVGLGNRPEAIPIWREVQFYNGRISRLAELGEPRIPAPIGDELLPPFAVDPETGRLRGPVDRLPRHVVVSSEWADVGVRGRAARAHRTTVRALPRAGGDGGGLPAGGGDGRHAAVRREALRGGRPRVTGRRRLRAAPRRREGGRRAARAGRADPRRRAARGRRAGRPRARQRDARGGRRSRRGRPAPGDLRRRELLGGWC
jgi:hypothetical protein